MPLIIKRVRIDIATADSGRFGTDVKLNGGFTVIRAENTRGKSTFLKAIIYALGLEGMLGASSAIPLTPSVLDSLEWNGEKHKIIESSVHLVIQGRDSSVITIKRSIKGQDNQKNLISVWPGDAIGSGALEDRRDFYVNIAGAAQNDAGFHRFLSDFINLKIPRVTKSDGGDCPLYLQCIFSAVFVEQLRGWGGILGGMPFQYGIKEPSKRVVEFILGLDANSHIGKRDALRAQKDAVIQRWFSQLNAVDELAKIQSGLVEGIPDSPSAIWPPPVKPSLLLSRDQNYISILDLRSNLQVRLTQIQSEIIPSVSQALTELHQKRKELDLKLRELRAQTDRLGDELGSASDYQASIDKRIALLSEDLRKNQDEQKLQKMDGKLWGMSDAQCPTCGQDWPSSLARQKPDARVMTIEENIEYIKNEMAAFQAMGQKGSVFVRAKEVALGSAQNEINDISASIRDINDLLVSHGTAPSLEAYKEQATIQYELQQIDKLSKLFDDYLVQFDKMSKEFGIIVSSMKMLPKGDVSEADIKIISEFETDIKRQLRQYKFNSFSSDSVQVNETSYRLISDGHEISPNSISASDYIRLIWSYHIALRRASTSRGHHPGLIIFDEPRQQSANAFSFSALLKEFASDVDAGHQTILATSEEIGVLRQALESTKDVQLIDFKKLDGLDYIIAPMIESVVPESPTPTAHPNS